MSVSSSLIQLPILYSFRRCPFAMRARLAIAYSGQQVEHREVVLKEKPQAMLDISPKGTVPVLQLSDGCIIEESVEIMIWAIESTETRDWFPEAHSHAISTLIEQNDNEFKYWLDRYKYADRYPEHEMSFYRSKCEHWFAQLDAMLQANGGFLVSTHYTMADMAIFPFIRQCAHVDRAWFYQAGYTHLSSWLDSLLASDLFLQVMTKHPQWKPT